MATERNGWFSNLIGPARGGAHDIDFLSALKGRDSDLSPWQDLDNPMSLTLSPRGALVPERP